MKSYQGLFIKLYRNKLGYSLESLSNGICSPSYLSKIENNETTASNEIISMLLSKLGVKVKCNEEIHDIRNKINIFFEYFFQLDTKAKIVAEDLLRKEPELEGSNVYLYFQIFKLYAQELLKKDLMVENDLEEYKEFMNSEEQRLFYIYKVWLNKPVNIIEENEGKRIFYLKGLAQREKERKNWFQSYFYLQEAYALASRKFDAILICDLLLDMGNLCVSNLEMMKKNFDKLNHISTKYLSKQYSQFYKSISFYNLGSHYLFNDKWKEAYQQFNDGYKSLTPNNENFEKDYIEKLFVTSCLLKNKKNANKWFLHMKSPNRLFKIMNTLDFERSEIYRRELLSLVEIEKDVTLWHYLLKRNSILTHHWKEAYQQEKWFSQQIIE